MTNPNGFILYRGPSMLDGKPIIVIATGLAAGSRNTKTGAMAQVWIMREDIAPNAAIASGDDASICGDCKHRGRIVNGRNIERSCYVTVVQAPLSVWKSYHRGIYPIATDLSALFAGRIVRLGAYGDPAAVPLWVWIAVMAQATGSGYTHQWRKFPELAQWCMASVDTAQERLEAKFLGFRTFRVRGVNEEVLSREVICPASHEAGKKITCQVCKACGGNAAKARADIVIMAHGTGANAFNRAA